MVLFGKEGAHNLWLRFEVEITEDFLLQFSNGIKFVSEMRNFRMIEKDFYLTLTIMAMHLFDFKSPREMLLGYK